MEDAGVKSLVDADGFPVIPRPTPPRNTSGIHPTGYKVLVEPKEVQERTAGGIILPDETKEKDGFSRTEGVLVEVSPMAFRGGDWADEDQKPRVGQRVMFAKYNAVEVTGHDSKKYWLMNDDNIIATVDELN